MSWPRPGDYQSALEFPARSLRDPALAACCVPDRALFDLPLPIAGANAHVYRLVAPEGVERAIRLFLKDSPARAARYAILERALSPSRLPTWFVPFGWQPEGIWAAGAWRPLLVMDWVRGVDLGQAVERSLGRPEGIRRLADLWRQTVQSMLALGVAHGDLQRGNVLVVDGTDALRLIDYDALWGPPIERLPPELQSTEAGHPAFQHPRGTASGAAADRFAALLIYVALRALAVAPEIWYRLDNGDNLLFRPEDLATPQSGRAFPVLREALKTFPVERGYVQRLEVACRGVPEQVPSVLSLD